MIRHSGIVEFWKDDKGFGFARPDGGGKDIFLHHSRLEMDGFKSLHRGERIYFEIEDDPKGPRALRVRREIDEQTAALDSPSEDLALALVDGAFRVVAITADGRWQLIDESQRVHSLLYVISSDSTAFGKAVQELEDLVNSPAVREQDLHDFFERFPEFILTDDYKDAHSKIALESDDSDTMIPDFVLEPVGPNPLCDLLELKLPQTKIDVMKSRRERVSSAVAEACAQLRHYRDYFEEKVNREHFHNTYGLCAFRPRMFVIIGRRGRVDPLEWRRIESASPEIHISTYDDILERAKHRLQKTHFVFRAKSA